MPLDLSGDLVQCTLCRRHFDQNRLRKHQEICKASIKMKRRPFDSFKQRVKGTVMEKHMDSIKSRLMVQTSKMNHGNWRKAHEEFISTIKAAKINRKNSDESDDVDDPCAPSMAMALPAI